MEKKFRFKSGTKVKTKDPQPQISEDQVSKLVAEKLAQMLGNVVTTPTPKQDDDFTFLEETKAATPSKITKAKLPKATGMSKVTKLEEKRLIIEDATERVEFDKIVQEFNTARGEEGKYKKIAEEGREIILTRMGENQIYEGNVVKVTIGRSKNEAINAEAVLKALVCNDDGQLQDGDDLKGSVQQLIDLARLGIIEIKKTDFDRWVKTHGYSSEPFIVKHADKKRIIVAEKK